MDAGSAKGDAATVLSSSIGPNLVIYGANQGSTGWQFLGVNAETGIPASSNSTNTTLSKLPVTGGGSVPDATQPSVTAYQSPMLINTGLYDIDQILAYQGKMV